MKLWTYKLKNAGNGFMVRESDPEVEYINIADVFMTNDRKVAEGRARLMAAAPELLEACQSALITLNINRKSVTCKPLEDKLRAVIEKATKDS